MQTVPVSDEEVFEASRDHSNHEGGGYCCPHCLESSQHSFVGDERTAVVCDHCGQTFVIWDETEIRQCSGKLADSYKGPERCG